MKIVVAGTGYVGLVTAVCLTEVGHTVTCVDVDENKIKMLQEGKSPIYEPGLEEIMLKNKNMLTYTTNTRQAYKDADVIFIGVGTPEKKDGSANLKYVYGVAVEIAESLEKDCIVVVKSTVPIGTNDKVEKLIKINLKKEIKVEVVSNPEFLSQGTAVKDTLHAQRIVLGVPSQKAEKIMKEVYDGYNIPYVITDRASAEMIKYASNDFLALKISYINEISNLCEIVGANIKAYDPVGEKNYKKIYPTEIQYCKSIEEALKDADICFIFTEWDFVKNLNMDTYEKLMKKAIIIDGRNCYSLKEAEKHNVLYESMGRKIINNLK